MPYKVANPRGIPPGDPVVSQQQDDGTFKHWMDGDTVKKADFPESGWQWLADNGLIVATGRSSD